MQNVSYTLRVGNTCSCAGIACDRGRYSWIVLQIPDQFSHKTTVGFTVKGSRKLQCSPPHVDVIIPASTCTVNSARCNIFKSCKGVGSKILEDSVSCLFTCELDSNSYGANSFVYMVFRPLKWIVQHNFDICEIDFNTQ